MKRWAQWGIAGASVAMVAPAPPAYAERLYLRESEVAREMFPTATQAPKKQMELSSDQLQSLAQFLGRKVDTKTYEYWEVSEGNQLLGWVFKLEVMAQTYPITFAVAVTAQHEVSDVQIMIYREPRGDEIRERRFRAQFKGKKSSDPLQLGRDIDAISGATISSRSAAYAAKKALGLASFLPKAARDTAADAGPR